MPTPRQAALGALGERLACHELRRRGYAILARSFRTRHGEIDIVARDGDVLVFVEVKTRASRRYGTALEAVTAGKQRRIAAMARSYLARAGLGRAPVPLRRGRSDRTQARRSGRHRGSERLQPLIAQTSGGAAILKPADPLWYGKGRACCDGRE